MAVLGKSLNGEHSPALENLLPLPGGEGWGEGEREFQLTHSLWAKMRLTVRWGQGEWTTPRRDTDESGRADRAPHLLLHRVG